MGSFRSDRWVNRFYSISMWWYNSAIKMNIFRILLFEKAGKLSYILNFNVAHISILHIKINIKDITYNNK